MKLTERGDEEKPAVVEPIMDNLMQASTDIDHARHVRDFTERLKSIVTPKRLEKMCRRYQAEWGRLDRHVPVAVFRRADSVPVVWKLLVEQDGRYLVDEVVFF